MAPEGAMAVHGGNWQIFQKMVERSGAVVCLNTSVVELDFSGGEEASTRRPQYTIRTKSAASGPGTEETSPILFDDVIIASPWQFSGISAAENVIRDPIDEIPYVQLHVTIFSSPYRYSPQFFDLADSTDVPGTVLTTLSRADDATDGDQGAGRAGFFSISTLRKAVNPRTRKQEYIYKIFSPQQITPEFLTWALSLPLCVCAIC